MRPKEIAANVSFSIPPSLSSCKLKKALKLPPHRYLPTPTKFNFLPPPYIFAPISPSALLFRAISPSSLLCTSPLLSGLPHLPGIPHLHTINRPSLWSDWSIKLLIYISSPICTNRLIFSKRTFFILCFQIKQERSQKCKFRLLGDTI